jgi:hypothetical protein
MRKRVPALLLAAFALVAVAAWLFSRPCGFESIDLMRPVEVAEAQAMPDGGTLEVRLVDAAGKALIFRRVGSLSVDPTRQSLKIVSRMWRVPIACEAPRGSQTESAVKEVLQDWLNTRLTADQKAKLMRNDQEALKSVPYEVIASYELLSWIDRRQ